MPGGWRRSCRRNIALYSLVFGAACLVYLSFQNHSVNTLSSSKKSNLAAANSHQHRAGSQQRAHSAPRTIITCPYARAAILDYLPVLAATVAVPAPAEWVVQKSDPPWAGKQPYPPWAIWGEVATLPVGMTKTEARGMKVGPATLFGGIMYSLNNAVNALPRAAPWDDNAAAPVSS